MTVRDLGDDDYDVVVVGGGPAGLSAGVRCANEGIKTLLIEKDPILTAKKSWILPVSDKRKKILESLNINPSEFSDNYIDSAKVSVVQESGNKITWAQKFPDWMKGYFVNHTEFTRYMLSKAKDLRVKESIVTSAKRKDGFVDLTTSGGDKLRTKLVIDATGTGREVSAMLGRERNWRAVWVNYGCALQGISPGDIGLERHQFMFEFGFHEGDFYVFNPYPAGENAVDFGMARYLYPADGRYNLTYEYCKNYLTTLYTKKAEEYKIPTDGTSVEREYYGLIGDGWETRPYDDNLLMVGDSAGHANDFENEGLLQSIIFGDAAGRIASESIREGSTTAKFLKNYYRALVKNDLYNRGLFGFATNIMPRDKKLLVLSLMCYVGNGFVEKYGSDLLWQWFVNEATYKDTLKLYERVLPYGIRSLAKVI